MVLNVLGFLEQGMATEKDPGDLENELQELCGNLENETLESRRANIWMTLNHNQMLPYFSNDSDRQ